LKPAFVVDASVAMSWCFTDEATAVGVNLLDRLGKESAAVPAWWFLEIGNTLAIALRKNRINDAQMSQFVTLIESFNLELDFEAPSRVFTHILPICRQHLLTSYDAVYLELAIRRELPLATLDLALARAAKKLGIKVLA
jgi:predicted nucleic acid-binding protein